MFQTSLLGLTALALVAGVVYLFRAVKKAGRNEEKVEAMEGELDDVYKAKVIRDRLGRDVTLRARLRNRYTRK